VVPRSNRFGHVVWQVGYRQHLPGAVKDVVSQSRAACGCVQHIAILPDFQLGQESCQTMHPACTVQRYKTREIGWQPILWRKKKESMTIHGFFLKSLCRHVE